MVHLAHLLRAQAVLTGVAIKQSGGVNRHRAVQKNRQAVGYFTCGLELRNGVQHGLRPPHGKDRHHGHATARGIAGGHKQRYRIIDFKRRKWDVEATVERLEYDPNRSAFIALVKYEDGELAYIIAPQRLAVGDSIVAGEKTDVKPGNAMLLSQMPVGTICHNIEMKPGKGGQIARSAGTYVQLVGRDGGRVIVRLNSGEQRYILGTCMGTVGAVSNPDNSNTTLAKAGRNRWRGIRPLTRGVAKNPVDHPHGGGEGRTSGGRHPVTPWGKPTKGARTRSNKSTDRMIIRSRHAKKKR
jgi:large subunit ribosomal protein L2